MARQLRKALLHSSALIGSLAVAQAAFANPTGGNVVAGSATIGSPSPEQLTITQSSNRAIIDWTGFDIAPNETTSFVQPGSSSVTLNRVNSATPSLIQGGLEANGRVYLVNPNGVVFGEGARVDVGGLVATTANIGNANFMAGVDRLTSPRQPERHRRQQRHDHHPRRRPGRAGRAGRRQFRRHRCPARPGRACRRHHLRHRPAWRRPGFLCGQRPGRGGARRHQHAGREQRPDPGRLGPADRGRGRRHRQQRHRHDRCHRGAQHHPGRRPHRARRRRHGPRVGRGHARRVGRTGGNVEVLGQEVALQGSARVVVSGKSAAAPP